MGYLGVLGRRWLSWVVEGLVFVGIEFGDFFFVFWEFLLGYRKGYD